MPEARFFRGREGNVAKAGGEVENSNETKDHPSEIQKEGLEDTGGLSFLGRNNSTLQKKKPTREECWHTSKG